MQIKRIFSGLVIALAINSCNDFKDVNGDAVKEKRTTSSFTKIEISGAYKVLINQGTDEGVILEADEKLLASIETVIRKNTLYISSTKAIGNTESLKLYITAVKLKAIDISGAIELSNKETFEAKNLEIKVNGASKINLDLDVENLLIALSGSSESRLKGKSNNFEISISGAGALKAKKMKTKNTTIDISGAGSATVFAKKTLNVSVSGAGSVRYKGSPKIKKKIIGTGSVEQL